MTTIDTGAALGTATPLSNARFTRLFTRLYDALAERALRRETLRALECLSDHALDDIGLTRSDVARMR